MTRNLTSFLSLRLHNLQTIVRTFCNNCNHCGCSFLEQSSTCTLVNLVHALLLAPVSWHRGTQRASVGHINGGERCNWSVLKEAACWMPSQPPLFCGTLYGPSLCSLPNPGPHQGREWSRKGPIARPFLCRRSLISALHTVHWTHPLPGVLGLGGGEGEEEEEEEEVGAEEWLTQGAFSSLPRTPHTSLVSAAFTVNLKL